MKSIKLDNSTYVHVYIHRIPVTMEEAELECLKKLIEIVKRK